MVTKRYSLIVIFFPLFFACARPSSSQVEFVLGTVCTVHLYEKGNKKLYSRIFARMREIDRSMTAFSEEFQTDRGSVDSDSATETFTSDVIAINRQAGREPVKVSADLIELLEKAAYYAELSDGAFDPTIRPLVQLWGIGTDAQRIPGDEEIAAALELVNWRDLLIDRQAGTAFLRREGMALDLGAIAKGYAGDEALRIARDAKVKRAIFDLGGNIVALGWRMETVRARKKELLPWRIGVQNPLGGRGDYLGVLTVHDMSVVTSGVYERYFESGGRRYHHILSTADGYPVDNGLLSVTIVTASSTAADALATAVSALGYEQGRALIDSIPDTEALFVFTNRSVRFTDGLAAIFSLSDNEFAIR